MYQFIFNNVYILILTPLFEYGKYEDDCECGESEYCITL